MRCMVPSNGGLGKKRATKSNKPGKSATSSKRSPAKKSAAKKAAANGSADPAAVPDISVHHTQLLKGVLDMCLLAVIDEEPSYGYEMVRKLADRHLQLTSEGSIYPLLSRLKRKGLVDSFLVDSHEGPARKYYRSTDLGKTTLAEWTADWKTFRAGVDDVLAGNTD